MTTQSAPPEVDVLQLSGITKRFGTTTALRDVSMSVRAGEIRGLVGRNGAGKSTLIAIITGLLTPDEGTLTFPALEGSHEEHVACVYQKSTLIPDLTAAENIHLHAYPTKRTGLVDWRRQSTQAREVLAEWGYEAISERPVSTLDPLQRKVVEICRALATGARTILLDEPTAGLDGDASRRLFDRVRDLRSRGIAVVFVSHYLDEVFDLCDTVTVVRDGQVVQTRPLQGMTVAQLVDSMVGDNRVAAKELLAQPVDPSAPALLEVEGLAVGPVKDFHVTIRPGECVGLVGLDGSGIFDVVDVLVGLRAPEAGSIRARGRVVPEGSVRAAIRHGIGFLPADRHHSGFIPGMAHEENSTLTVLDRLRTKIGLVNSRARSKVYDDLAASWEIKASSGRQATEELSGGNQQKVALARAFASRPDVLVLANPTAGVDVSAKASIVESVAAAVHGQDSACLIVSSDETEFAACSRLLVMFRGEVIGQLQAPWDTTTLAAAVQGDIVLDPSTPPAPTSADRAPNA